MQVWCDQRHDPGGWTVIQRRLDGSVNFFRNWETYKVRTRQPIHVFYPLELTDKVNLKGGFRVWPRAYLKKNIVCLPFQKRSLYKISYCRFLLENTLRFTTNTDINMLLLLPLQQGFGNIDGEYWLGLENIYWLTNQGNYKLLITMEDWSGRKVFAEYASFRLEPESEYYKLRLGRYNGNAGDSFTWHNGKQFTTLDRDHDVYTGRRSLSAALPFLPLHPHLPLLYHFLLKTEKYSWSCIKKK